MIHRIHDRPELKRETSKQTDRSQPATKDEPFFVDQQQGACNVMPGASMCQSTQAALQAPEMGTHLHTNSDVTETTRVHFDQLPTEVKAELLRYVQQKNATVPGLACVSTQMHQLWRVLPDMPKRQQALQRALAGKTGDLYIDAVEQHLGAARSGPYKLQLGSNATIAQLLRIARLLDNSVQKPEVQNICTAQVAQALGRHVERFIFRTPAQYNMAIRGLINYFHEVELDFSSILSRFGR